ncbi:MAG: aryl-sulfate sulfotransferase [Myxococcota bacterium]
MWTLVACAPSTPSTPPAPPPQPIGAPTLAFGPDPNVGPARIWRLETAEPTTYTLTIRGGGESWTVDGPAATRHAIPVVGLLPLTTYRVTSDPPTVTLAFTTPPAPRTATWPSVDVLVHDPARAEPGWTLVPFGVQGLGAGVAVLYDEQARPRWWYHGSPPYDVVLDPVEGVWVRDARTMRHLRWTGETLAWFAADPDEDQLPLEGPVNHELVPDGDGGFWTFGRDAVTMYVPSDYGSTELVQAEVDDSVWQHVGPDGALVSATSIAGVLDPSRCGYDALTPTDEGTLDFVHANAGVPLDDGGVIVSSRNQDAIFRLDPSGELAWILGDPTGWTAPWTDKLLRPVGPLTWPYHQHGIEWHPDTHTLLVFDNHASGAIPPNPKAPGTSRAVAYEIDEQARTVREAWVFDTPSTGPLFAPVLGEVDLLPITGNHLAVYGWIESEGPANGWGQLTGRLVEFDAAGASVLEWRFHVPLDTTPEGVWIYRAERGVDPARVRAAQ